MERLVRGKAVGINGRHAFFVTADAPLVLIRKGTIDRTNTEMMNARWRYFYFWKKIPQAEQKHFAPCGRCFARFILSYVNNETQ